MKKILGFVCGVGLMMLPLSGHAETKGFFQMANPGTNPLIMTDSIRGLVGNILSLISLLGGSLASDPEMGATLNVTQEEVAGLLAGDDISYKVDEGTGTGANAVPTPTYDYVNEKVLPADLKTPYAALNSKITTGADMEKVVKEMFFIANSNEATDEKQAEIQKVRNEYLTKIGKEYTRLAYNVQQKLIEDMDSVSSDINGNGSIGAISGMDQTWKAVNRALIADIAMQIQLMELDAAKFLSVQPFVLLTEERPGASTNQTNNNGGNS